MVGNIVQGNRLASAQGRDMGVIDEESDSARKVSDTLFTEVVYILHLLSRLTSSMFWKGVLRICCLFDFSTNLSAKF